MIGSDREPGAGTRIVTDPPRTAGILAEAFAAEPGLRWTCGEDPARRLTWLVATERLLTRTPRARRYGVDLDGTIVAAAWVSAPTGRPTIGTQVAWLAMVVRGCGLRAVVRTARYRRREQGFRPPRAWTLELVGVVPRCRGAGTGGMLIRRVLADLPADAVVHLTTADPRNYDLYRHLGFAADGAFVLGGVRVVAMSRRAGPSR